MICFGNVPANAVLPIMFTTYGKTNGESITLTGLAVTDIEIYKGTSMTQRASDNGYTLLDTDGIDIDSVTGLHGFSIDLADNSDSGFFAAGSFYTVVVSAVTIDSQTVTFIAATFRIVVAEGTAGTPGADAVRWNNLATVALPLIPTTAGRTLDVSATGEAGVDWANVGSPTTVVGLSGTTVKTATDVETDTQDIQTKIGTPAGASLSADIAAIEAQTDDIGAAGAGLTAVPWNAAWDAEVQSEVDDALVAQRLDELLNADSDIDGAAPPTVGSVFHEVMSKTAGSFTFDQTTDSLEAVRDKAIDIETDTQDIQSKVGTPAGASVSADVAAVKSDTAAILVDTGTTLDGRIPAALVSGRMDASVGAMAANVLTAAAIATDAIDADAVAADAVTEIQSGLSTLTAAGIRTAVGLAAANLDTQLGDLPTAIENADALLKRDIDNVEATAAVHSLCSALLKLVSKFEASTGKTYRTDGTTTHMTQTVTTDDSADPITTIGVAV